MTRKEKILELRGEVERTIAPLIGSDYVLLDLPYHTNIGDTLIWEGELHFLQSYPYRMLACGFMFSWRFPRLKHKTTILLHGGGNFGSVWPRPHFFRRAVINHYRDHPIVILPQTVHYKSPEVAIADAAEMSHHPNLTICARDHVSYDFLNQYFHNHIVMAPDMAFCIPPAKLEYKGEKKRPSRMLAIKRTDKEALVYDKFPGDSDMRDWPTMEVIPRTTRIMYKMIAKGQHSFLPYGWFVDQIARYCVRPGNIRAGIDTIGPYNHIYTDRLHGAILAILMDKPDIHIIDNNYGKNSSFFNTWLTGIEGVHLV